MMEAPMKNDPSTSSPDSPKCPCCNRRHLDPSELRLLGNQHVQTGYLVEAGKYYSKALAHSDIDSEAFASDKVSCLSNRAEVYLRLERWQEAVNDAQEVLKIESDHTKAKFRLAKGWSRMGQASDTLVILKQLEGSRGGVDQTNEIQELTKDCRRISKEELGNYDIPSMMKEASKRPGERLSSFHTTFRSPKIAVGVPIGSLPSSEDGIPYRGCKAVYNLKEGELIMSSKAFAIGPDGKSMMDEILSKLYKTPSLRAEFFSLTGAGDSSLRPDGDGNDVSDDSFAEKNLDRVRGIGQCNTFPLLPYDENIRIQWKNLHEDVSEELKDPPPTANRLGLWINESMLNNSCTPNCMWTNIGDQIFIYTTKPVQPGDELCTSYYPTFGSYEKRREQFGSWIRPGDGFDCVCDHCELLRSRDDLRQLADYLFDEIQELQSMENDNQLIAKAVVGKCLFPCSRRREIFSSFSHLPLRLQHTRVAELHELEGWILAIDGDVDGALKAYQTGAKINYEVRGSGDWKYFLEHWRIAGLAVACEQCDLARESLEKIWKSPAFEAYPKKEAELMFQDLTHDHVMRLIPPLDPQYVTEIETQIGELIYLVLNE